MIDHLKTFGLGLIGFTGLILIATLIVGIIFAAGGMVSYIFGDMTLEILASLGILIFSVPFIYVMGLDIRNDLVYIRNARKGH